MNQASTRSVVGIALVCAVVAGACTIGAPADDRPVSRPATSAADASTTATAIDLLKAGTAFIDQISFVAVADVADGEVTTTSRVDNMKKRSATIISSAGASFEIRMVDDETFMLAPTLPGASKGWMILDPAKVPAGFGSSFARGENDPGGTARLFNAIVSARATHTEVSGTIDIIKLGTGNGLSFRPQPGSTFPDSVRDQEFQAALDSEGRLTSFTIPGSEGLPTAVLRYSDFGTRVTVPRPPRAAPAPETLYPQLGLR